MGHLHLRKILKEDTMYKDKMADKHRCEFMERCLLKIVDSENNKKYYNVLKCNKCLSFKSIGEPGNIKGAVLSELTNEQKKLPIIEANCKHYYNVVFAKLENVKYIGK